MTTPRPEVAALAEAGFEPPENVCAACGHRGGDHDLRNWCLICPRPDVEIGPTDHFVDKRVKAGWCFFSSMAEPQRWALGIERLEANGWTLVPAASETGLRDAIVAHFNALHTETPGPACADAILRLAATPPDPPT